jgi:multicomponent Na+:H+ antiporter subunit B
MIDLYILLGLMIIGAIVAIEVKDLLSSVVAVGGVGLVLALTFLVLKAPDVAMMQLVVEILCLVALIRATLNKDIPFSTSGRWFLNTCIVIGFIAVFLTIAARCLRDLPAFGYPLMKVAATYLHDGLTKTGATNLVAAVILDYRAYDTLGEATVLFTAVLGVISVVRRVGRKDPAAEDTEGEE